MHDQIAAPRNVPRLAAALVGLAVGLASGAAFTGRAAAAGPTPPPSPTPAGGLAGDLAAARTTIALKLALLDKLGRDALHIHTELVGDKVTLSGTVGARASQELAEEVALSVSGIRSVDNRLRLAGDDRPPSHRLATAVGKAESEVADAALESRVKLRLLDEMGLSAFNVEVEAVDGIVSLRGTLNDEDHRDIALRTARHTPGAKQVLDLLRVR